MKITYKGIDFYVEYQFNQGTTSGNYDVPDDPAEIEITKATVWNGQDDLLPLLCECGWIEEIARLVIEKL